SRGVLQEFCDRSGECFRIIADQDVAAVRKIEAFGAERRRNHWLRHGRGFQDLQSRATPHPEWDNAHRSAADQWAHVRNGSGERHCRKVSEPGLKFSRRITTRYYESH